MKDREGNGSVRDVSEYWPMIQMGWWIGSSLSSYAQNAVSAIGDWELTVENLEAPGSALQWMKSHEYSMIQYSRCEIPGGQRIHGL